MPGALLRRIIQQPRVGALARDVAHGASSLAQSLDTPREVLFAVSELTRRRGGDRLDVADDETLTPFELRAFSQNGEDGVLVELLRRAGEGGRVFVEFGAGNGLQNSCVLLAAVLGWSGLFIEGDKARATALEERYRATSVKTRRAMVTPTTVDDLFASAGMPEEPDVLSIDVDGADYWIWRGLQRYRPRIVVIEYNASLGPERALAQPPDRSDAFDHTSYGGASIAALRKLGASKGYRLVHTEMTGNNAFFVREDQPGVYPPPEVVPLRPVNHYFTGTGHRPDVSGRQYVDVSGD